MSRRRFSAGRTAFTMLELVVALLGSSVLLASVSSVLLVTLRASDTSFTPAKAVVDGHVALTELQADVQYATAILEFTSRAITFRIPDRDGNGTPDTVRYYWSGTAGSPVTRQYNSGTVHNFIPNVHALAISFYRPGSSFEYMTFRLQLSSDAQTVVETSFPLLNRP